MDDGDAMAVDVEETALQPSETTTTRQRDGGQVMPLPLPLWMPRPLAAAAAAATCCWLLAAGYATSLCSMQSCSGPRSVLSRPLTVRVSQAMAEKVPVQDGRVMIHASKFDHEQARTPPPALASKEFRQYLLRISRTPHNRFAPRTPHNHLGPSLYPSSPSYTCAQE